MIPGTAGGTAALDSGTRALTRVVVLFSLTGRLEAARPGLGSLVDTFDFGRFALHLTSSEGVLPVPVLVEDVPPEQLRLPHGDHGLDLATAQIAVLATPRGDITLALDCGFAGHTPPAALAAWLADSCFDRDRITLGPTALLDALSGRLAPREPLAFGQNVHQLVFPGGDLESDLLDPDESRLPALLNELVYRGRLTASEPPHLRRNGRTLSAHGRGVSVHAGWAGHVENGLILVAVGMISALAVLQRTRLAAFETMRANEQASASSPYEIRSLISRLSAGVNELQLDLAFGVEAYVDSLLIPEMVMEAFQSSLRDAFGIRDSLDNSARMVERLTSVISARSAALNAELSERDDRRDRTVSALVAIATLIALPPTLLLAFFGANATTVNAHRSIFDARYLPAYLLAWVPFLVLAVVGYVRTARIGRRSGSLLTPPAPVPAPRPPSGS
ncbi:hypothetical protein M2163_007592 [Streptomyces sp. SAI-135]|uniref:hypothetical protein n=1 Tax=unclassified Streptomyces TaxID=2593676 RepID=UPI002472EC0E|nr:MULTISPECIES: hypothetical protein [unclassified Streptomyces]MDH6515429.1 hypothetical protein [Streptomyces sp. SAI-090]MDH6620484.1 hypothetical protein [Streptomyces sp. SAI-135]